MPAPIRGIDSIWVHIRDVREARKFYRDALGLKEISYSEEGQHASYKVPGVGYLGIHKQAKGEPGRRAGTVSGVYFKVADVKKTAAQIAKRGGKVTDRPEKKPWGNWNATIADPDGNEFVITD
jgi:predicted enzyme related to lactoylglutathione lyase